MQEKNGFQLDGRAIMVREDREDRDIKRGSRRPAARPQGRDAESSGLQVRPCVCCVISAGRCVASFRLARCITLRMLHPPCCSTFSQIRPASCWPLSAWLPRQHTWSQAATWQCCASQRHTKCYVAAQVVVHGIPWSYDHDQLEAMFTDYDPSFQIEVAEVIYGRDGRSRVRALEAVMHAALCAIELCLAAPALASDSPVHLLLPFGLHTLRRRCCMDCCRQHGPSPLCCGAIARRTGDVHCRAAPWAGCGAR